MISASGLASGKGPLRCGGAEFEAFKEAVAQTRAELAHRGVTLGPVTVADTMERNVHEVADRLGIRVRSAWRYFGAAALAERLAKSAREFDDSSGQEGVCRQVSTNQPLDALLARINPAVRGWCAYFRPGVSFANFSYRRHLSSSAALVSKEIKNWPPAGHRTPAGGAGHRRVSRTTVLGRSPLGRCSGSPCVSRVAASCSVPVASST